MVNVVSIHALREESDPVTLRLTKRSKNFNPHSPCGERRKCLVWLSSHRYFNPRSPCGERRTAPSSSSSLSKFQSTLPLRGVTYLASSSTGSMLFQSTLPWRGVTINIHIQTGIRMTFQSTLSMRRATSRLPRDGNR